MASSIASPSIRPLSSAPPKAICRDPSDDTLHALQRAGEPPRRELFIRLNVATGAAAWLVRMREHLHDHQKWVSIERDLTHVLRVLFNRAGLDFQQIDLETPCGVLERLIEAEAVHPIHDWTEMARRLEADRRCYAFFHPAWPQQPLIFTEVALTRGITSTIRPILDPDSAVVDPRTCDTAMFYSISNCQAGLRGFSFGNPLLSRAIERLRAEMPWLRRFATISPIPGFRSWLAGSTGLLNASTGIGAWLSNDRSHSLSGTDTRPVAGGAARPVRALSPPGEAGQRTSGSRRAFPSWKRCAAASAQLVE